LSGVYFIMRSYWCSKGLVTSPVGQEAITFLVPHITKHGVKFLPSVKHPTNLTASRFSSQAQVKLLASKHSAQAMFLLVPDQVACDGTKGENLLGAGNRVLSFCRSLGAIFPIFSLLVLFWVDLWIVWLYEHCTLGFHFGIFFLLIRLHAVIFHGSEKKIGTTIWAHHWPQSQPSVRKARIELHHDIADSGVAMEVRPCKSKICPQILEEIG
jgi:hypothetical protein